MKQPRTPRHGGHGQSLRPKPPSFKDHDNDPDVIPSADENTGGLEYAHVDTRANQATMAAAALNVPPAATPRGIAVPANVRGDSAQTMERYNKWREKNAAATGVPPPTSPAPVQMPAEVNPPIPMPMLDGHGQQVDPPLDPPGEIYVTKSAAEEFLEERTRVTIELNDGIFALPAISVRQSSYCVMVLVPLADDLTVFVPKPGTELTLVHGDARLRAYFPGSYVEYPELGAGVLTFIRIDAQ